MSEYMIVNGELCHYGIPGMRWGRRKAILRANRDIVARTKIRDNKAAKGKDTTKADRDIAARTKIRDKKLEKLKNDDFNRLKKEAVKAGKVTSKNSLIDKNKKEHITVNQRKIDKAVKKVYKLMNKLDVDYDRVGAMARADYKKGKVYVDVMLDKKRERIYID